MPKSTASFWNPDRRLLLALASLAGVAFFLTFSALTYRIGFPLDDTWIHLTYARNFALHGEWSFRLGHGSAGSTSPLWTGLLAIGFLLRLAPYFWTFFLGWAALSLTAIRAEDTARRLIPSYRSSLPWVGLFIALAWHLTWSAVSGMETLLHGLLILNVMGILLERSPRYLTLGLLAGLSIWVRPDGLTLLGPILFTAFLQEPTWRARGNAWLKVLLGFGGIFVFYLLFNLALSGTPMPNTYYAKQAEYASAWLSLPLSVRLTEYLLPMLASPFLAVLPGFFLWAYRTIRERHWGGVAGLLWFLGYVGIYLVRLPAYQHGRYILPAFPSLYLWGLLGMAAYLTSPRVNQRLSFLWQALTVILVIAFQWVGAAQNARDVAFIETQMVQTAHWINQNLPAEATLAVHDIGAIGYFTPNPLVDLAGLITPDVIPFIRDERRLAEYINASGAEYLVTFSEWYPRLVEGRTALFQAASAPFQFDDEMRVYHWR
jgi:hypothetical protein